MRGLKMRHQRPFHSSGGGGGSSRAQNRRGIDQAGLKCGIDHDGIYRERLFSGGKHWSGGNCNSVQQMLEMQNLLKRIIVVAYKFEQFNVSCHICAPAQWEAYQGRGVAA